VLWRQFEQFDRTRSFLPWACGVARFEVSNYLRSRSRKKLYFSDDLNLLLIEAQVEISSDEVDARKAALGECIQKLRPRDRELLDACYADAARVEAVAEAQGRIPQSVHNSLRRIRDSLFECIQRTLAQDDRGGATS
jgi:RNA polymerase sigma-70 factor (ECF subfamily)